MTLNEQILHDLARNAEIRQAHYGEKAKVLRNALHALRETGTIPEFCEHCQNIATSVEARISPVTGEPTPVFYCDQCKFS